MKKFIAGSLAAAMTVSFGAAAALADDHKSYKPKEKVVVVERNDQGKATMVKVGDKMYPVCMNYEMTDGCIQPRAAGLDWGNYPANTWPRMSRR
ncbi:hypothetical protein [Erythrobacter litoralis]|uniref:Uncharacterized protein n=1 Tax=Erythrobacter litoralis (strain HTCC2594) TaxID=314225 RepID=Q2N9M1_ERYLH|nr:hypothetical protein [Erythrobacter litoralis]ABC63620.1 hypothetical protein ELI_07640 [Erythrobacter litoralis HTCC2594]